MIELRWFKLPENRTGFIGTRILQYRQMIDKTVYAAWLGNGPMQNPKLEWSDWINVPEFPSVD